MCLYAKQNPDGRKLSTGCEINARVVRLQQRKVRGSVSDDWPLMQESTQGGVQVGIGKEPEMKRIDAIIRQQSLDNVRECLTSIGVEGLTVMDVLGFGRQIGRTEVYRGCEYRVDFHPKLLLTILTRDDQVDEIVNAIIKGARTGKIGDGKIVVTPIDEVIRIRTGEIGKAAV